MNFSRIMSCSTLLPKVQLPTLAIPAVTKAKKVTCGTQCVFLSYFCNPFKLGEINKLTQSLFGTLQLSARGLKTRGHLQLRCKDCYMARKDGVVYVLCESHPRHKQVKLTKRTKYSWILTYAFQTKKRPY